LKFGMIPSTGLSFSLAQTPWHIGEFLALTSRRITGTNILYSGLSTRWISPEAFSFMEVTSEHKLEVSEKDATALISEHFIEPPKDWVLKPFIPVINDVFGNDSVLEMLRKLKHISENSSDEKIAEFAAECEQRIRMAASPVSLELTNLLIKNARNHVKEIVNEMVEDQGSETTQFIQSRKRLKQEHITKPALIKSVADEVRANINILTIDENFSKNVFTRITDRKKENLLEIDSGALLKAKECLGRSIADEFVYHERSDFTLSAHPKLRKFHPDFNYKTGLDHDPLFMQREVERWSDMYLESTRDELRSLVSGIPLNELKNQQHLFSW